MDAFFDKHNDKTQDRDKDYLTVREAQDFFEEILDLDYSQPKAKATFRKIMSILDPLGENIIRRADVMQWLSLPGFVKAIVVED